AIAGPNSSAFALVFHCTGDRPIIIIFVFLNQLYKTPVELHLDKNPDLRAIRFASFNPILDPWIYILLRKTVLLKLIEKIKCLFCKIGARRRQQRRGNFPCTDAHHLSSVISSQDTPSLVSHDLQNIKSNSQTFFYVPEETEQDNGNRPKEDKLCVSPPSSVRNSQASYSSEKGSMEAQMEEGTNMITDLSTVSCTKDPALRVTLNTETVEEKCI
ncbi:hypothetical protein GOODEAATRI_017875, partial [Goodea atripinnis]